MYFAELLNMFSPNATISFLLMLSFLSSLKQCQSWNLSSLLFIQSFGSLNMVE